MWQKTLTFYPTPTPCGGAVVKAVDKGKIKGRAMAAMVQQTDRQLAQLYKQMQLLADQAKAVQKRVEISEKIYLADMSFEPLISHVYYLYEKEDGSYLVSMIGPTEWGKSQPYKAFLSSVSLLADHTWEVLDVDDSTI